MAKTTKKATTKAAETKPAALKFKKFDFALVKGQNEPCQIVEIDEKNKAYKLYIKTATFSEEVSSWIKENQLKPAPKKA